MRDMHFKLKPIPSSITTENFVEFEGKRQKLSSAKALSPIEVFIATVIKVCCFVVVVFVALHPMSTAMVIAGRSVHLTTLFPGQA